MQSERWGLDVKEERESTAALGSVKAYRPALLVIMRHGQSLRNVPDASFDVSDASHEPGGQHHEASRIPDHLVPLTALGEEQARVTGEHLRAEFGRFDHIFHSPWLRTTQTAQIVRQAFPEPGAVRRNLFLTEQQFGQLDPALWHDRPEEYRAALQRFEQQRAIVGKFYCRPPDGESWADVCIRTHQFLGLLFRPEHHAKRVLVVTHSVTQQSFRYHLEHPTEEELVEQYKADPNRNCGVGAYKWTREEGWKLLFWNKPLA
jgi:broad specificity phosphatase PhoE